MPFAWVAQSCALDFDWPCVVATAPLLFLVIVLGSATDWLSVRFALFAAVSLNLEPHISGVLGPGLLRFVGFRVSVGADFVWGGVVVRPCWV